MAFSMQRTLAKLVCLTLGAVASLAAQDLTITNARIVVANGTVKELQASTQPRVRQFLDRVPEPELTGEFDYLQMLTGDVPPIRQ